ncbi:MAG: cobalamin B12-binding domain-containing protein [Lachnospiraceae bacterium]|nr:cobalamin B12-binding domain-containing protein [Lachnospiraceae bacterium]
MNKKTIIGASIGNCVHVAGVIHFLELAEDEGYNSIFLGPAVSVDELFENIDIYRPDMVGVGYRLTPENVVPLLEEINRRREKLSYNITWVFGGTMPVAHIARKYGFFSFVSDGTDDIVDSIRFLRGDSGSDSVMAYPDNIVDRIKENSPYPVLRHHFGLPSLEDTIDGVRKIAEAKVLDVISIGPDQNTQQFFFKQDKMNKEFDGAGGVPIRTREDFRRLKEATMCGNQPLLRCYSGTEDVFEFAELLLDEIDNAWTAIPLCWYNELDGRGTRVLESSIEEAQRLIKWHAERNIPVEINEPHHWAMRDAHDVMSVVMAYVSALNAKELGVKNYISQYMFNVPNGLSFSMDLARVLAMIEMVESLEDKTFKTYRQTRAGLPLFSSDLDVAKGQLAASTFMQMSVKPDIMHVVAFTEANHAATAEDVIASTKIVKGVIKHTLKDAFSIENNKEIQSRKNHLLSEARYVIDFIEKKYSSCKNPLTDSFVLADCIKSGIIDAVHILKGKKFKGDLYTRITGGMCEACDKSTGEIIDEATRLNNKV